MNMVGAQQEAEDIVQEAFLRLHSHQDSVDEGKHKAWLYRVAVNLGHNALLQRKRHHRWRENASVLDEMVSSPTPSDEKALGVREVLSELPARQAQLLFLYAAGLSYEEMAETLEVKTASLSQLLLRAKKAFKNHYGTS